ncbi:MAG: hypothetical protein MPEBLZ_02890 [Candidatus Methanoperedens nitroreducens]|uniref:Uncharacterized protein n=1 Tax=Candidatus Methanoperedens nitratireducens TaxID=1392998 RepID=A0A0P7ZCY7_9EURY|nr:MAG: hypothetical protein MPEBLZ_02890 [Candidatus Methanoperedens sp. BLZ1]CAG0987006.1 hypothetical protein METP2_02335 [Methanosarcinales archaeon]
MISIFKCGACPNFGAMIVNQIFNDFNRGGFSITFVVVGIKFLFLYINKYNIVKEYERELEYRIEKQRYE